MTSALSAAEVEDSVAPGRAHQGRLDRWLDQAQGAVAPAPWLYVVLAAVAFAALDWAAGLHGAPGIPINGDGAYFAGKGSVLLSRHALSVYADPALQSGPWQLLAWRGLAVLGGPGGSLLSECVAVTLCALAVLAGSRAALSGQPRRELVSVAAVFLLLLWGPIPEAFDLGHLSQIAIPLLWLVSARAARRGSAVAAGLVLGATVGIETWGVLGVAVLLLLPGWPKRLTAGAVFSAVVAATYLPFAVHGPFRMFEYHWTVSNQTLVHLLVGAGHPYTWQMRMIEAVVAVGISAGVALRFGRSTEALWLVVVVPVTTRLLLDPQVYDYYLIPLRIACVVGVAVLLSNGRWRSAALLMLGTLVVFTNGLLVPWLALVTFAAIVVGVELLPGREGQWAVRGT